MRGQFDYLLNGLKRMDIDVAEDKLIRMLEYKNAVLSANERLNLTSITEDEAFIELHIIDSLTLLKCVDISGSVIDIGTGAGIPGMILKIARPEIKITLLDSLQKRLSFLSDIVANFSDGGVDIVNTRAELGAHDANFREQFDICISRAVAPLPVLCEYCLPYVKKGGKFIAMKGKNISDELERSKDIYPLLGAEISEVVHIYLPYSESERNLIVFEKTSDTPEKYPRNNSAIKKDYKRM